MWRGCCDVEWMLSSLEEKRLLREEEVEGKRKGREFI
jgi:hypothetical protein